MMRGPIGRLARERVVRRDDSRLPSAWLGSERPQPRVSGLSWLSESAAVAPGAERGSPVLVMLGPSNGHALTELLAHAGDGERAYVLVPPDWGQQEGDQVARVPRALIRRVPEVPASGVHAGNGARLWLGGAWSLRLDPAQSEAFRQVFLRLFWHDATEEAWTGGRHLAWRAAAARPFDVRDLRLGAAVRLVTPDTRLQVDGRNALVHVASGTPPDSPPRRLWYPAGAEHHDRLSALVRHGTEIVWEDRGLPDLVVSGDGGQALLPGSRGRLCVLLTRQQAADATRLLQAPGQWRFAVDQRLGDLVQSGCKVWIPGEAAAREIEREQPITVADVAATTLRAMPDAAPSTLPPPQALSPSVRYSWTVLPPLLPAGATEDPLASRWRQIDEEWIRRVNHAREALEAAEVDRGRIGKTFSRLVSAMLGFEHTQRDLFAETASMRKQRPSAAGPTGAAAMLSRLAEIEDKARELQTNLEDTERKARSDEEREKQESEWRSRVEAATRDLPVRHAALGEADGRLSAINQELASVEEAMKSADKAARTELNVRKHRLTDDRARLNKEASRLRNEVRGLEQQARAAFEFRPPSYNPPHSPQVSGRFVPRTSTGRSPALEVPDDALPEVGALRFHKKQRYLAIQAWEDLEAGERAAIRLSATLVASEDKGV